MQEITAPNKYDLTGKVGLFLAGSINLGNAEHWQQRLISELHEFDKLTVLNPRRKDWDVSWIQKIDNPKFKEQVDWELEALERAGLIALYFDANTHSPITLMELGLFADNNIVVCCPQGYFRKGNVDIVCERYEITEVESWDAFVGELKLGIYKLM